MLMKQQTKCIKSKIILTKPKDYITNQTRGSAACCIIGP